MPDEPTKPEPDPALIARDLADLKNVIKSNDAITPGLLTAWASDIPSRVGLLEDTYWGSVRWPRSLGKPYGPSLASGFEIKHEAQSHFHYIDHATGDIVDKYVWLPGPRPSTWDAPDDDENYRFRFTGYAARNIPNVLIVRIGDLPWTSVTPKHMTRRVIPYGYEFRPTGKPLFLDEFEVVQYAPGFIDIRRLG